MKGFLQRVIRRAAGRVEGLRPRIPLPFEPPSDLAVDPPPTRAAPWPHAALENAGSPGSGESAGEAPVGQRGMPPLPQVQSAEHDPRIDAGAAHDAPADTAGAGRAAPSLSAFVDSGEAIPIVFAEPGDRQTAALTSPSAPTSASFPSTTARPDTDPPTPPRWRQRPSLPSGDASSRFGPEHRGAGSSSRAAARSTARHQESESAPEHVVRVTIERLDVNAVAPASGKPRARPAAPRRDTLAEYLRRRQEAKR